MSTKSTIKYVPNKFHLYDDGFGCKSEIHLEIENGECEVYTEPCGNTINLVLTEDIINAIMNYALGIDDKFMASKPIPIINVLWDDSIN